MKNRRKNELAEVQCGREDRMMPKGSNGALRIAVSKRDQKVTAAVQAEMREFARVLARQARRMEAQAIRLKKLPSAKASGEFTPSTLASALAGALLTEGETLGTVAKTLASDARKTEATCQARPFQTRKRWDARQAKLQKNYEDSHA